jgi:hypothetical protein
MNPGASGIQIASQGPTWGLRHYSTLKERPMDCARSIELLSDYDAGLLGREEVVILRTHLTNCGDCDGVFEDLRLIIRVAIAMRSGDSITYPDGEALWQSLSARRVGH